MRFFLLSKADFFGNAILNRLLPGLCRRHAARMFLSDCVFPGERDNPPMDAFMRATRDWLLETLFPLVDSLPPGGRAPELLTFSGLAEKYGAPMIPLGGEWAGAMATLHEQTLAFRPEVILCCRHDFIIPPAIYSLAGHGAYNTHSGALPDYRGLFCSFWTMYNRDPAAECVIHTLKPRVDTGDIVARGAVEVDYSLSLTRNLARIYRAGADAFLSLLPALEAGPVAGAPQPPGSGRYYPLPNRADCEAFASRGGRLVDEGECGWLAGRYLPEGAALPAPGRA